jgi:hypothetical protein
VLVCSGGVSAWSIAKRLRLNEAVPRTSAVGAVPVHEGVCVVVALET